MHLTRNVHFELLTYIVVWSSAVLYSIYCFTKNSEKYFQYYNDVYSDFTPGWNFLSRKKDVSDYEWQTMKTLINKLCIWVILSVMISELLRRFGSAKILQMGQILITIIFVIKELGIFPLIVILFQPLIFTVAYSTRRSRLLIWLCNGFALLLITIYKHYSGKEEFLIIFKLNDKEAYITILAIFWMNLRCVSYYLDLADNCENHKLLSFLSYALYLPTAFCGPFITYNDFKGCHQFSENFVSRVGILLLQVCRFVLWLFFAEFALHFIYVNAAAFHTEWVESLDSWSLYGYGYTMGQFFHIKYLVVYGLATSFAKFENVKVPSLPVCIGRIHLYSDMWKYFDAGLYNFLLRYIYIPSIKSKLVKNRLLASLICFIFVYVWHGTDDYIMVWTFVNYIAIVIENTAQWMNENYLQHLNLIGKLGPQWFRRICCIVASPLLAVSAISNFYFFARSDIGHIFTFRLLNDNYSSNIILLGMLYCCCQVSTEVRPTKTRSSREQKREAQEQNKML